MHGVRRRPEQGRQAQSGQSYIKHIDSADLLDSIARGKFEPTSEMKRLGEADCIIICVPTPLNESRDPDLSYIEGTAQVDRQDAAARHNWSCSKARRTRHHSSERAADPRSARASTAAKDYFLAYSPEREDPGNPHFQAATIPKVVGGFDETSTELACALYGHAVVKVVRASSMEVAEACKILENTYRAVNIALVNELKMLYDKLGIDVWEVIEAAKTKPFGFQAFYPGPGLGGHCIPIDPFYLTWLARKHGEQTRFIELAGEINTHMPQYVINRLAEFLNDSASRSRAAGSPMLGVATRRTWTTPRRVPSFELMRLLRERGALLTYNDPHVATLPRDAALSRSAGRWTSRELTPEFLAAQDAC